MDESELTRLDHDVTYFAAILKENADVLARIASIPDPVQHCARLVFADLLHQVWQLSAGTWVLLNEKLELPLLVTVRSLFECAVTLGYLSKHAAPETEASILLAYTYLRDVDDYSQQKELVEERNAILTRLPRPIVDEAHKRAATGRRSWSGKTVRQMATEGGVAGYDLAYGAMSGVSHAARSARYVRFIPQESGAVRLEVGSDISDADAESTANFARRTLHHSFRFVWEKLEGPPLNLRTTNPEEWRRSLG